MADFFDWAIGLVSLVRNSYPAFRAPGGSVSTIASTHCAGRVVGGATTPPPFPSERYAHLDILLRPVWDALGPESSRAGASSISDNMHYVTLDTDLARISDSVASYIGIGGF